MDICTQYARYLHHCARSRIAPQGFGHFVVDIYPFTEFAK